jgi:hypothetical protein
MTSPIEPLSCCVKNNLPFAIAMQRAPLAGVGYRIRRSWPRSPACGLTEPERTSRATNDHPHRLDHAHRARCRPACNRRRQAQTRERRRYPDHDNPSLPTRLSQNQRLSLEHGPEKHAFGLDGWIPVFRKDHALGEVLFVVQRERNVEAMDGAMHCLRRKTRHRP